MCTVRELIEKLGELDPDTSVQVIGMYSNGHGGRDNEWIDLDISEYYGQHSSDTFQYIDFRNNILVSEYEKNEKPILLLGDC